MDHLHEEVAQIRANTVASNSRAVYKNSYTRFLAWLVVNKPTLIPTQFCSLLGDDLSNTREKFKTLANGDTTNPPLYFEALQARDFVAWLLTLRKFDGSKPGYSTYNSHRAGLFNLYREYGQTMQRTLESELTTHFKGLKRQVAVDASQGRDRVKTGKDPLSFTLYEFLCTEMLKRHSKDMMQSF